MSRLSAVATAILVGISGTLVHAEALPAAKGSLELTIHLRIDYRIARDSAPGDAEAMELAKLQGVWINEYTEHDGVRENPDSKHVIVGNRYFRIEEGLVEEEGVIKIDLSGPVKKIDYTCLKGVYEGKTWKGIYRIERDRYTHFGPFGTIRWKNRPTEFAEKTNAETWLRVMKRESK